MELGWQNVGDPFVEVNEFRVKPTFEKKKSCGGALRRRNSKGRGAFDKRINGAGDVRKQ